jgi:hypothetical protein
MQLPMLRRWRTKRRLLEIARLWAELDSAAAR